MVDRNLSTGYTAVIMAQRSICLRLRRLTNEHAVCQNPRSTVKDILFCNTCTIFAFFVNFLGSLQKKILSAPSIKLKNFIKLKKEISLYTRQSMVHQELYQKKIYCAPRLRPLGSRDSISISSSPYAFRQKKVISHPRYTYTIKDGYSHSSYTQRWNNRIKFLKTRSL